MFQFALAFLFTLAAVVSSAFADISVHAGNHSGFGRLVFDLGPSVTWELTRGGENTVELDQAYPIGSIPDLPRNFKSVSVDGSSLHVTLKQGASLRVERIRGLLVLDAFDSPSASANTRIFDPQPAPAAPLLLSPPPDRGDEQSPPSTPDSLSTPPILSLQPTRPRPDSGGTTSVVIPFDPGVGAAAFEAPGILMIVFDTERPIDMMDLRQDPVFGKATAHTLPGATILRLPVAPNTWPALQRDSGGWRVSITRQPSPVRAVGYSTSPNQLLLSLRQPGHIVKILDPTTGAAILVGTVRGRSAAVGTRRSAPQFLLLPTILGVAVEPFSDRLTLEERPDGFSLTIQGTDLALTPESPELIAQADAAGLTTRFDISPEPGSTLFRQMRSQMSKAALAPPLARGPLQREVARTMIALGMGPEAEAMLRLAALQDPREADIADHGGLTAMASILAHRADSDALQAQDLSGTDEVTLWHALWELETDQDSGRRPKPGRNLAPRPFLRAIP